MKYNSLAETAFGGDITNKPELLIVMPVFNEQASVRKVVTEWFLEIENWTENFLFLAIDDGSIDETRSLLNRLSEHFGNRLEIHSRENRGHGQTCLEGYRIACKRGIPWVMQIDSDGQCDPQYFFKFWRERQKYDAIYGSRVRRDDGWRRVLASRILQLTLLIAVGVWCVDANVPYRLMKTSVLEDKLKRIPSHFFLANVALAVLLKKDQSITHNSIRIHFRERFGGEPSIRIGKFGAKALELVTQLRSLLP